MRQTLIGLQESHIPRDIIQDCPHCCCIPASILFILKCHNPQISLSQRSMFTDEINFEKAKNLTFSDFRIDYKGFSLDHYCNDRGEQFEHWKEFIIQELKEERPVAVCFKTLTGTVHCKVIFQERSCAFKIFNPGISIINESSLKLLENTIASICNQCCVDLIGNKYYSCIETYTFIDAYDDLMKDILQMQVLTITPI